MTFRTRSTMTRWCVAGSAVAAALILSRFSSTQAGGGAALQVPPIQCENIGGKLQLNCPVPPSTNVTGNNYHTSGNPADNQWDIFAWNTFIAMNWPAMPGGSNNLRGFPDLNSRFVADNTTDDPLVVWETFKEKREVFKLDKPGGSPMDPGDWNSPVDYGPPHENIPPCSKCENTETKRLITQTTGVTFDSLDETVEVKSESLERTLPNGQPVPPGRRNQVVGPRVWKGQPIPAPGSGKNAAPVLYEVKVNYDFFNYVRQNKFYDDKIAFAAAQVNPDEKGRKGGNIRLPYRTTAPKGTREANPNAVFGYQASDAASYYINKDYEKVPFMPPYGIGSVHIKAAWIPLVNGEDPSRYHTANALYYRTENQELCKCEGTFGLIGLHIIQRVHKATPNKGTFSKDKAGGTFIFATWEHVDIEKDNYQYTNYYDLIPKPAPYPVPQKGKDVYKVQRRFKILEGTSKVNTMVWNAIKAQLKSEGKDENSSVWLNYQLVGTQFMGANTKDMSTGTDYPQFDPELNDMGNGQPFYLANLVIETNDGLQHFQGRPPNPQPPTVNPIEHYGKQNPSIKPNPSTSKFDHQLANLPWGIGPKKGVYNMGGCMACHGVAQTQGYSFSFVLLAGQRGTRTPDTENDFELPFSAASPDNN